MIKMQWILDLIKKSKYLYTFAFLLPVLIYGTIFVLIGVAPFGHRSILVTDMHTQYVQFYTYLYDVLKNGKSLFYSWEAGMGLNFYGVFAYYLASPFSFIIVFFDRSHLPEAMAIMTLLKVGLAGLTMAFYLTKVSNRRGISILYFSTFYSLMSFVTVYSFCVMWLDGIYLLPLVLYGVEQLLKSNRYIVLTFSLALMFISNFYIAYMAGIFTFLFFVARFCMLYEFRNFKIGLKKFLWFCLSTAFAAGMSAVVTIPMFLNLQSNFANRGKIPFTTEFNFDLVYFYSRLLNGVVDTTVNGLPNVYSGVLTLLLVPLFFISKKINLREKIIFGALLAILLISFEIPFLNLAWHAFQKPTNFPYRYSFLFSFSLIFVAFRTYSIFDETLLPSLKKVVLFNIFMIVLLSNISSYYMTSNKVIINIFFVLVYWLLLVLKVKYKNKKPIIPLALAVLVLFEVALNTVYMIKLLSFEYGYINRASYQEPAPGYSEVFKKIANRDKGFYRVETTAESTWNDSLHFGYKGITHFNTVANGHLNLYMQDLGYGYLDALILQSGRGIVSTDSLLGVKYMVSNSPLNQFGFKQIDQVGNFKVYQNQNVLPVGYMMDKSQFDTVGKAKIDVRKVNYTNSFDKQNQLIQKSNINQDEEYYKPLRPESIVFNNLDDVTKQNKRTKSVKKAGGNTISLAKRQDKLPANIKLTLNVKGQQQVYMKMSAQPAGYTSVYVNGKSLGEKFSEYPTYYWNNGILDLGAFNNAKVTVEINILRSSIDINQNIFYGLDIPKFTKRVQELRQESLSVKYYNERSISGTINVKNDNVLFLSIPYDKGWKATVDGKAAKILKLNDAFTGIDLSKGHHKVDLVYTPPGFKIGLIISLVSLGVTLMLIFFVRARKR
jgi:uncharacterized membrane protein YfhO